MDLQHRQAGPHVCFFMFWKLLNLRMFLAPQPQEWILHKVTKPFSKNNNYFSPFLFLQIVTLIARHLKANWRSTWRSTARKITVSQQHTVLLIKFCRKALKHVWKNLSFLNHWCGSGWKKKVSYSAITDVVLQTFCWSWTNNIFHPIDYIPVQHVAGRLL